MAPQLKYFILCRWRRTTHQILYQNRGSINAYLPTGERDAYHLYMFSEALKYCSLSIK